MKPFDFTAGEAAERHTVVLLHSSASSSRQWNALAELLRPRYDVRTVDFHGHGTRAAWHGARPLTLADEVALVEPILQEAGSVHLVGHSYGGAVALKLVDLHPQSVRSLVVYEPVLFNWLFRHEPDSPAAQQAIELADSMRERLERGDAYAAAEQFIGYWAGPSAWLRMGGAKRDSTALRMRSVLAHFGALSANLSRDCVSPDRSCRCCALAAVTPLHQRGGSPHCCGRRFLWRSTPRWTVWDTWVRSRIRPQSTRGSPSS